MMGHTNLQSTAGSSIDTQLTHRASAVLAILLVPPSFQFKTCRLSTFLNLLTKKYLRKNYAVHLQMYIQALFTKTEAETIGSNGAKQ